ncbi:anti-sigma factor family protein [Streptomyces abyssomicinicus]|uniref:anti-sigma factor family protein n=1 Tax=Streptomyces abyssomicinicus TaxID=574929 RepID=UPI00124F84E0|nr:hypothetical protein [Streptomyces abyssomicinicus]
MTSTKDTAGHPDVTEISDLVEGVLAPDRTASVSGHLEDCVLCTDVQAALEEIRGALGTLPGPVRMPADVAGRIDAALAAEVLLSTAGARAETGSGDGDAEMGSITGHGNTAPEATTSAAHVSRETARPTDRRPNGPGGTHPPVRPTSSSPGRAVGRPRTRRRRSLAIGAVFATAAAGIALLLMQPFQEDPAPPTASTFSGRPLEQEVTGLLAEADESGESSSPQPRVLGRPDVDVPACVREGIDSPEEALAAQKGTFQGKTAYLVVLPDPKSDARVLAYVVDASCITDSSSGSKAEADVLLRQSYARTAG